MSFTNDDLKRVKGYEYRGCPPITKDELDALIARLEAANKLAQAAAWVSEGNRQPPDWDDLQDALAAYEKARGLKP